MEEKTILKTILSGGGRLGQNLKKKHVPRKHGILKHSLKGKKKKKHKTKSPKESTKKKKKKKLKQKKKFSNQQDFQMHGRISKSVILKHSLMGKKKDKRK